MSYLFEKYHLIFEEVNDNLSQMRGFLYDKNKWGKAYEVLVDSRDLPNYDMMLDYFSSHTNYDKGLITSFVDFNKDEMSSTVNILVNLFTNPDTVELLQYDLRFIHMNVEFNTILLHLGTGEETANINFENYTTQNLQNNIGQSLYIYFTTMNASFYNNGRIEVLRRVYNDLGILSSDRLTKKSAKALAQYILNDPNHEPDIEENELTQILLNPPDAFDEEDYVENIRVVIDDVVYGEDW